MAYDVDRHLTQIAYPNAITQTLSYNSTGQLTRIAATKSGGTTLTSSSYSYTNPGNGQATLLSYSVTDASGNTTSYTYDALNRLTQAVQKNGSGSQIASYAYGYDPAGNMTSQTINGAATSMSYNAANELTAVGSTTYSYDANGNETGNSAGLSLAYNAQDQTTSATPPGGTATSYGYTEQGQPQRVSVGSTSFQYDVTGLSAMTTVTGTTYFTRLPDGRLLSERTPSGTDYYLVDGLNSVLAVANSAGNVVNSYRYDPFGNATSATEQVANPFRFDGMYLGQATGFYKMGQRYYTPSLGRWTQEDRVAGSRLDPQALDRYTFAANNPINAVDLSGLLTGQVCLGTSIGLGWYFTVQGCVATDFRSLGFTGSVGAGGSSPTASVGGSLGFSTANTIRNLRGPSAFFGCSYGEVPYVGHESTLSSTAFGDAVTFGAAANFPVPAECHSGAGYTWTT